MIPPPAVSLTDGVLHRCGHYPEAMSCAGRDNNTGEAHAVVGAGVFASRIVPELITSIVHYLTDLCDCFLLGIVGVTPAFGLGLTTACSTAGCRMGSLHMLPPARLRWSR